MVVLAIAALIIVIVLIAIPALQRNQRNTARDNDAARVIAEVSNSAARNNGTLPLPADSGALYDSMGSLNQYDKDDFSLVETSSLATDIDSLIVVTGAQCTDPEDGSAIAGASRQYAVIYAIETAGDDSPQCING